MRESLLGAYEGLKGFRNRASAIVMKGLLGAYEGLKGNFEQLLLRPFPGLLGAYEGLKVVVASENRFWGFGLGLLGAYEGLKAFSKSSFCSSVFSHVY